MGRLLGPRRGHSDQPVVERSNTTGTISRCVLHPGGMTAIPRLLSPVSRYAATPLGSKLASERLSGGVAALNHRLMAIIPPGWKTL